MRAFEDLRIGDQFHTAEMEISEADIIAFARQYDPQPFHTSTAGAPRSLFGRLVASGWHTAALTMRLMVEGEMQLDGGVIGQGVENLRWPRPVLPGDRLRVVVEVVEIADIPSRPAYGLVKQRCRTFNQAGKVVQEMTATLLVARRTPAG
ncbi:MAG: MaoC family dehydratase [Opitutales bacterium]